MSKYLTLPTDYVAVPTGLKPTQKWMFLEKKATEHYVASRENARQAEKAYEAVDKATHAGERYPNLTLAQALSENAFRHMKLAVRYRENSEALMETRAYDHDEWADTKTGRAHISKYIDMIKKIKKSV